MKKLFLMVMLMLSFSVSAMNLSEAKEQGLVGEQANGLLGVVEASTAANELVKDINSKRLVILNKMAEKNGMTLEQVSILAGEKAIKKTPAGQYIRNASGQWVVK